jgi:hypothetical protein
MSIRVFFTDIGFLFRPVFRRPAQAAGLALFMAATVFAAAPLDAPTLAFLAGYEKVRAALADDNLAAAQAAAAALDGAAPLAQARSIGEARKAFRVLSARAVALAAGQPGFYHLHCGMYPGGADWVQTVPEIANPYFGHRMLRCGEWVDSPAALAGDR